ncbi:MAG: SusC/RagA family TonB-linked outer membrane protein [Bacteroidia bacterium]|nr:SusC/RagA family TonB-linked outer membrane protein [Bacteroidia bacterium]
MKDVSLRQIFNEIEKKSDYVFLFSNSLRDEADRKTDIDVSSKNIEEVLAIITKNTNIVYEILGKQIILYKNNHNIDEKEENKFTRPPQSTVAISGKVRDEDGHEIPGVAVIIAETRRGTATDEQGNFSLNLFPNEKTLIFSCVGMNRVITAVRNQTEFNIVLKYDHELLHELIVTGYQTISREQATGSFVSISPQAYKGKLQTDIISRLEGLVPGLVKSPEGRLSLRGIVSLKGDTQPLFVVDGTPFEGNIKSINPSIIENITVLKDAAAASIYGARAANGVIVISTKKGPADGKTHISYDGSVRITSKPNFDYLNLINSKELVDLQVHGFKYHQDSWHTQNPRLALNPVLELLYKHKARLITGDELNQGLNAYRALDNREQLKEEFLRTAITQQHNLTFAGGNEKNRHFASLNYLSNQDTRRHIKKDEQIGFTFRNNSHYFNWLTSDFGVAGSFNTFASEEGMGDLTRFLEYTPTYYMLRDHTGEPLEVILTKSQQELQRLRDIGLKDESYNPIRDRGEETQLNKSNYFRIHAALNLKFTENLNMDINYQTEFTSGKEKRLFTEHSHYMRNMINDAAQYNPETKKITYNIPEGGHLRERRFDTYSYTLRTQLNYTKNISVHYFSGLLGAERRLVRSAGTNAYFFGYDDTGLGHKLVNPRGMAPLMGTESVFGDFYFYPHAFQNVTHTDDRFVSFYANAAYSFAGKYKLTGSIRTDQSNLFGTDPSHQYRPLWSLGAGWNVTRESFMQSQNIVSTLEMRASYGIGGNIPKDVGPYLTLTGPEYSQWHDDFELYMQQPPNPLLRWEKTASTNLGLDFGFLNNRIAGSIDFYNKKTTDLLGFRETDDTRGWERQMLNYGAMKNTGMEFSLHTLNIDTGNFVWNTTLNFSYNKNRLMDVDDADMSVFGYLRDNVFVKGYPAYSLFGTRFAGLDSMRGEPLYYDSLNEKHAELTSVNDLVYKGTTVPPYHASFTSNFNYKNLGLSFLFVYYGGHVIRNVASPYLSYAPTHNVTKEILNIWKEPGDEKNPLATPAFTGTYVFPEMEMLWYAADRHVLEGNYIKLRDISLTYSFGKNLLSNLKIESMMAALQIQNAASWYANNKNFDPETASINEYTGAGLKSLPIPASYTLGLSVNF